MQFIDKAKIYIEAGKGGDGTVAFRREAHVPKKVDLLVETVEKVEASFLKQQHLYQPY